MKEKKMKIVAYLLKRQCDILKKVNKYVRLRVIRLQNTRTSNQIATQE